MKIGNKYKIIATIHGHDFENGEIVTIDDHETDCNSFYATNDKGEIWIVTMDELEAVSLREEPQERVWKELREQQYEEDMDMDQFLDYLERNYNISKK